ncbi:threonine aldolase family protein [Limisalsivibrio acetivorans]|uniref:threonine aldolase family protein n=1 Tax=Limisalsivibrio acetivorans TaxID=1304888 RepID=UPI0003B6A9F9|nr:low specificity L-threonine aldolase [Limisalsivibrio acetivorans]
MNRKVNFLSDNCAGVLPEVLEKIERTNTGYVPSYGNDSYTDEIKEKMRTELGDADISFVLTGTGANVICIDSCIRTFQGVVCPETAHINVDECGAPERFTGSKLLTVPSPDGKLTVAGIKSHMHTIGFEHHTQPKMISISQATECGTLYTIDEIKELTSFAHENGMVVHMDGARLVNAAASLKCSLKEMTKDAGVDLLSFGGTKGGLMMGEAIVFFNKELAKDVKYIRKQATQLYSKVRFVAAQFDAFFTGNLWQRTAEHANSMAAILAESIGRLPGVEITQAVEINAVFAKVPEKAVKKLLEKYYFYVWDPEKSVVRLMTSFQTQEDEIGEFTKDLEEALKS